MDLEKQTSFEIFDEAVPYDDTCFDLLELPEIKRELAAGRPHDDELGLRELFDNPEMVLRAEERRPKPARRKRTLRLERAA